MKFRISGKNLGALALPDACHRCFWIKQNLNQLPFSIFPGIFSTFDAFNKKIVHSSFDCNGEAPIWLSSLGNLKGYIDPPSHHRFQFHHKDSDIILTGAADGIYMKEDGSVIIVDYKTAKYTSNQDALLPMYEVQLNCYAMIAEALGISPVSSLALIYFDPTFSNNNPVSWKRDHGFDMGFSAHILHVNLNRSKVLKLLGQARDILTLTSPPKLKEGCKDCLSIERLLKLLEASTPTTLMRL